MLDTDTKRRIDTARDILVGKVPDPKSQVEQITIALIYKFMDDMDAEAEELGGKRKFFTGDFARYGWAKLMSAGIGGHELIGLYGEGISTMPQNPGIPPLFRDIFKNAYLPYRDPETLKSFLKIIDEFSYDHSERLGDAFEYLLSVLGSQGDAGQFRTPRHIIDFMVEVMAPKKGEVILDPACGTAGFLISAWKHILRSNTNAKGHSTLTPDEKGRLATNFKGYDISPDMVRLSLVNLYLHGFTDPHIYEYDTLTSEERWNDFADVILANPPFMSPKGGIKPHKRFSIQAKRSEVLFVDYMAEHLTPTGRAGIIVPEGIIFQSQTAYKDLRKMLVENSLVAVISLPAGVFQPYSGVKTSILILDKSLAKQSSTVAFFKVENDGFGLGAQRRANDGEQLTQVAQAIKEFFGQDLQDQQDENQNSCKSCKSCLNDLIERGLALIVPKEKIAANGDYGLSGERYRENGNTASLKWPMVELGKVARFINGRAYKQEELLSEGPTPVLRVGNFFSNRSWYYSDLELDEDKYCNAGDLLYAWSASFGPRIWEGPRAIYHYHIWKIEPTEAIDKMFLHHLLALDSENIKSEGNGIAMVHATKGGMEQRKFPLPPLEVQKEIVAEIEGYQKVINGARAVLDNYRPHIPIHPDWPVSTFEDAPFKIIDGDRGTNYPSKEDFSPSGHCLFLNTKNVRFDGFKFNELEFISTEKDQVLRKGKLERGDVLLTTRGTVGNTALYDSTVEYDHIRINSGMLIFRPDTTILSSSYLFHFFQSENFQKQKEAIVSGAAQPQLPIRSLNEITIPIPPLATQQAIVAEIEAEQALVNANRELIERFEKKIQATLARVWGEEVSETAVNE
jgi:type I restriction enzyme M protein